MQNEMPDFLNDYDLMIQHFRSELEDKVRGKKFERFVQKLIPQTEIGDDFYLPNLQNESPSSDDGVDIIAEGKTGKYMLCVQAKFEINRKDTIDSIISKFLHFNKTHTFVESTSVQGNKKTKSSRRSHKAEQSIDTDDLFSVKKVIKYMIVTLSPLSSIIQKYEDSRLSSKEFYSELKQEKRIIIVDGYEILRILKNLYTKLTQQPTNLKLTLETNYIRKDNVYLTVVGSSELKKLYQHYGESLFFENVRDFITTNPTERTPNQEILDTVKEYPNKMLERNNGIVIRASKVDPIGEKLLELHSGNIVNGCQTTMCIVKYSNTECFIPVKIVESDDRKKSWEITRAANYQNSVDYIDLDIASYMRPAIVKKAAFKSGLRLTDKEDVTALNLLDVIYDRKVSYEDTKLLFLGLFSRNPTNVFNRSHGEVLYSVVEKFYEESRDGQKIIDFLFLIQGCISESSSKAGEIFTDEHYANNFKRFFEPNNPAYKCITGILALAGIIRTDISDRQNDEKEEYKRMKEIMETSEKALTNSSKEFLRTYILATEIMIKYASYESQDTTKIGRDMSRRLRNAPFTKLFTELCVSLDRDKALQKL